MSERMCGILMARRMVSSESVAATRRKEAKVADLGSTLMLYSDYLSYLLDLFLVFANYRRGLFYFLLMQLEWVGKPWRGRSTWRFALLVLRRFGFRAKRWHREAGFKRQCLI